MAEDGEPPVIAADNEEIDATAAAAPSGVAAADEDREIPRP